MLTVSRLMGLRLEASDGDVGRLRDVLFDDDGFRVRWLVVRPQDRHRSGPVLVKPEALRADPGGSPRWRLTPGALREGPDADADLPVSRRGETCAFAELFLFRSASRANSDVPARPDPRLQSCREIMHYAVLVRGEILGRVRDVLLDERSWTIEALLVRPPAWRPLSGRPIAVTHVSRIDWEDGTVRMRDGTATGAAPPIGVAPSALAL